MERRGAKSGDAVQPEVIGTRSTFQIEDEVEVSFDEHGWSHATITAVCQTSESGVSYDVNYRDSRTAERSVTADRIRRAQRQAQPALSTTFAQQLGVTSVERGDLIKTKHGSCVDRYDTVAVVSFDTAAGTVTVEPCKHSKSTNWQSLGDDLNGVNRRVVHMSAVHSFYRSLKEVKASDAASKLLSGEHKSAIPGFMSQMAQIQLASAGGRSTRGKTEQFRTAACAATTTTTFGGDGSREGGGSIIGDAASSSSSSSTSASHGCNRAADDFLGADDPYRAPADVCAAEGTTTLFPYSYFSDSNCDVENFESVCARSRERFTRTTPNSVIIILRSEADRKYSLDNFRQQVVLPYLELEGRSVKIISIVKGPSADLKKFHEQLVEKFANDDRISCHIIDMSRSRRLNQFQTVRHGLAKCTRLIDTSSSALVLLLRIDCFFLRSISDFGFSLEQPTVVFEEPWASSKERGGHHAVFTDIVHATPAADFPSFRAAVNCAASLEGGAGRAQEKAQRLVGQWELPRLILLHAGGLHIGIPVRLVATHLPALPSISFVSFFCALSLWQPHIETHNHTTTNPVLLCASRSQGAGPAGTSGSTTRASRTTHSSS